MNMFIFYVEELEKRGMLKSFCQFVGQYIDLIQQVSEFSKWYKPILLEIAIAQGHLPRGSHVKDLTIDVRQEMKDSYLLRSSIELRYLPPNSGIKDLTLEVRDRMLKDGHLVDYSPDGVVYGPHDLILDPVIRTREPKYN